MRHYNKAMEDGKISDDEAEHIMLARLRDPNSEGHAEFTAKVKKEVPLDTKNLVGALNEQMKLRYAGNDLFAARRFEEAKQKYVEALSIMVGAVVQARPRL